MAEKQSTHRQSIETTVIQSDCKSEKRGQIFGFIIILTGVVGGMVLLGLGKNLEGFVSFFTSLATLAGAFLIGKKVKTKELQKQAQSVLERTPPKN